MIKDKVSVVIPDRNGQPYLQKTIDSLLDNAEGDVEVIVTLNGIWPNPTLRDDKRLILIHHGKPDYELGMREGINRGVKLASGEYILKSDGHCMFDKGYDTKLKADCDDDWVVIPRRYRLDADEWIREDEKGDKRPPVDYMYLAYPYERPYDKTCGLHGSEWRERHYERQDILIDDTMSWQGSSYFMKRLHWDRIIGELDTEKYGTFTQEAQEIGNKTWLSGGRLVVNKKTWYAHMHKGKKGKGYAFTNEMYRQHMEGTEKGRLFCIDYWVNNRHLEEHPDWKPFEWLLERFAPVPTWPENWREQMEIDKLKDYSTLRQQEGTI